MEGGGGQGARQSISQLARDAGEESEEEVSRPRLAAEPGATILPVQLRDVAVAGENDGRIGGEGGLNILRHKQLEEELSPPASCSGVC